jgi:hypothetical protein
MVCVREQIRPRDLMKMKQEYVSLNGDVLFTMNGKAGR